MGVRNVHVQNFMVFIFQSHTRVQLSWYGALGTAAVGNNHGRLDIKGIFGKNIKEPFLHFTTLR